MTSVVTPWAISGTLMLAACATGQSRFRATNIWPPPGLTEAQADEEINFCLRAAPKAAMYVSAPVRDDERVDLAYLGCLGGFHFTVELPNGAIISPSPQSQVASEPPSQAPPPNEQQQRPLQASSSGEFLSPDFKKKLIDAGLKRGGASRNSCGLAKILSKRPFIRCMAVTIAIRMGEDIGKDALKSTVCGDPSILLELSPKITPQIQSAILEYLGCSAM